MGAGRQAKEKGDPHAYAPYRMPRMRPQTTAEATTQMRALLSLFPTDLDAGAEDGGSSQSAKQAEADRGRKKKRK